MPAPAVGAAPVSAVRARLSGPPGIKGIIASGKTTGIAFFASLGGFVYGYNQGMFAQVLTMSSFVKAVSTVSLADFQPALMQSRQMAMLRALVLPRVY